MQDKDYNKNQSLTHMKPGRVADTFNAAASPLPSNSEILIEDVPFGEPRGGALAFDAAKYMRYVEDGDMTEAQAKELLESIWLIVVGFVDLGFGMSPIQQAMDKSKAIEGRARRVVVSSDTSHSENNKSTNGVRARRAPREGGIHEPH